MYSVGVREHFMVAHSFQGTLFGPAQQLHGHTYTVDVEFRTAQLTGEGVVVDIARAHRALRAVLDPLNYKNLDELPEFQQQNTTTEFLAKHVFDRLRNTIGHGALGPGATELTSLKVTLHESHIAWASYEGSLRD